MSTTAPTMRPLTCWKSFLRESRLHKSTTPTRQLSSHFYNSPRNTHPPPPRLPHFPLPSSTPKTHVPIKVYTPPPSARKAFPLAIIEATNAHVSVLDPTGARTRLFARSNTDAPHPGDILLVTFKTGDPFAGVCLSIRRRGTDTAVLLRNRLLTTGVEMWVKIYSPTVRSIEVVQRAEKRARRARLYYMRKPKHDRGSVEKVVEVYLRNRRLIRGGELKKAQDGDKGPGKSSQGNRGGQKSNRK